MTPSVKARALELTRKGHLPSVALRKALREAAAQERGAPHMEGTLPNAPNDPAASQDSLPEAESWTDMVADSRRPSQAKPDSVMAIREQLLKSYEHQHLNGISCAFCGSAGSPVALHIVEFRHPEAEPTPSPFIPMSQSRGTTRGSVPVCILCSPPCQKCALPVATPWIAKMMKALQSRDSKVSIAIGNGVCHQHIHPIVDTLGFPARASSQRWRSSRPRSRESGAQGAHLRLVAALAGLHRPR